MGRWELGGISGEQLPRRPPRASGPSAPGPPVLEFPQSLQGGGGAGVQELNRLRRGFSQSSAGHLPLLPLQEWGQVSQSIPR